MDTDRIRIYIHMKISLQCHSHEGQEYHICDNESTELHIQRIVNACDGYRCSEYYESVVVFGGESPSESLIHYILRDIRKNATSEAIRSISLYGLDDQLAIMELAIKGYYLKETESIVSEHEDEDNDDEHETVQRSIFSEVTPIQPRFALGHIDITEQARETLREVTSRKLLSLKNGSRSIAGVPDDTRIDYIHAEYDRLLRDGKAIDFVDLLYLATQQKHSLVNSDKRRNLYIIMEAAWPMTTLQREFIHFLISPDILSSDIDDTKVLNASLHSDYSVSVNLKPLSSMYICDDTSINFTTPFQVKSGARFSDCYTVRQSKPTAAQNVLSSPLSNPIISQRSHWKDRDSWKPCHFTTLFNQIQGDDDVEKTSTNRKYVTFPCKIDNTDDDDDDDVSSILGLLSGQFGDNSVSSVDIVLPATSVNIERKEDVRIPLLSTFGNYNKAKFPISTKVFSPQRFRLDLPVEYNRIALVILSYLRLACNIRDNISFIRVMNSPCRGLPASVMQHLRSLAILQRLPSLCQVVISISRQRVGGKSESISSPIAKYQEGIVGFCKLYDSLKSCLEGWTHADTIVSRLLKIIQKVYTASFTDQTPTIVITEVIRIFHGVEQSLALNNASPQRTCKMSLQDFVDRCVSPYSTITWENGHSLHSVYSTYYDTPSCVKGSPESVTSPRVVTRLLEHSQDILLTKNVQITPKKARTPLTTVTNTGILKEPTRARISERKFVKVVQAKQQAVNKGTNKKLKKKIRKKNLKQLPPGQKSILSYFKTSGSVS